MSFYFVAFLSRSSTSRAYNLLSANGVSCTLFSTPRQLDIGCGLSIKFDGAELGKVKMLLGSANPNFVGYYRSVVYGNRRVIVKI